MLPLVAINTFTNTFTCSQSALSVYQLGCRKIFLKELKTITKKLEKLNFRLELQALYMYIHYVYRGHDFFVQTDTCTLQ